MIKIKDLTKDDIGKWVLYKPSHSNNNELGRIKSWSKLFIFVVYKCDNNWDRFEDYTGCATTENDLKFVEG